MPPGDLGISRVLRWALSAAVLTPILTGILVAVRDPVGDLGTSDLVGLWVEFEVLVLVAVAVACGSVRARSERRRRTAISELRRRAARDPLTGLLNRRGLVSLVSRKSRAEGRERSVLLIDIDGFKEINDSYGHVTGDRVLIAVADYLFDLVAEGWAAARLGGDEFLLLKFGTGMSEDEAAAVVGHLPEVLARQGLPSVTASFGRASDAGRNTPLEQLVAAADGALARQRGVERGGDRHVSLWGRDEEGSDLLAQGWDFIRADRRRLLRGVREAAYIRRVGIICAALALVISVLGMIAIPLDLTFLRTVEPEGALSFTTSFVLALAASTLLYFLAEPQPDRARIRRCRIGGGVVTVIGILAVLEHLTGQTFLPTELIHDPLEGTVDHITRPDLESGLGFIFGGLYTAMLRMSGRVVEVFRVCVSVGLIAIVAGAGFGILLGAGYLWNGTSPELSPQGMVASALIAAALLAAEPRQPLMRTFLSTGGAARILNSLALAGVTVPLIAGAGLVHLDLAEGLGWEPAVMVVAAAQAVILAALTLTSVKAVARADAETAVIWRRLSEAADRDPLTGLFTRERFDREVEVSRRLLSQKGRPYSVVLLDLDHLKTLNKSLGYAAGDRALCNVASALQTGVRPSDLPVRLGGDEFGILLPGTIEAEAEDIARRCAERIEAVQVGDQALRASWGVATAGDFRIEPEQLLRVADQRLYASKSRDGGEVDSGFEA